MVWLFPIIRSRDKDGSHTTELAIVENAFRRLKHRNVTCNRTGGGDDKIQTDKIRTDTNQLKQVK